MNKLVFIYTTVANIDEASKLARALVERNLVACANMIPKTESIYQWEGEVVSTQECTLILKTTPEMADEAKLLLAKEHSYECPCIVSFDVETNNSFFQWVWSQTGQPKPEL